MKYILIWNSNLRPHDIYNWLSQVYLSNQKEESTVKPVLKTKICFQEIFLLNAGQKHCRMITESILQYFRPSLSYHLSLRPLFCLFLSSRLRQVLLY